MTSDRWINLIRVDGYMDAIENACPQGDVRIVKLAAVMSACVSFALNESSLVCRAYNVSEKEIVLEFHSHRHPSPPLFNEIHILTRYIASLNLPINLKYFAYDSLKSKKNYFSSSFLFNGIDGGIEIMFNSKDMLLNTQLSEEIDIGPFELKKIDCSSEDKWCVSMRLSNVWMLWFGDQDLLRCEEIDISPFGLTPLAEQNV